MLSKLLASLSEKDRTVAFIVSLLIVISAVSGITVYIYKRSEVKDQEAAAAVRRELLQEKKERREDQLRYEAKVAECQLENLRTKDEFVRDLQEQRDKMLGISNQTAVSVRKIQTTKKRTNRKLDALKEEIVK